MPQEKKKRLARISYRNERRKALKDLKSRKAKGEKGLFISLDQQISQERDRIRRSRQRTIKGNK